jgi:hypothetical protein
MSKRATRAKAARHTTDAFRDAVKDILRCDGTFLLADGRNPEVVWTFDGFAWMQSEMPPAIARPERREHGLITTPYHANVVFE